MRPAIPLRAEWRVCVAECVCVMDVSLCVSGKPSSGMGGSKQARAMER